MEAAVLEVILDPGPADPADAAVHDDDFPVVDVAETDRPAALPSRRGGLGRSPRLGRPDHADVDAAAIKALVERTARAARDPSLGCPRSRRTVTPAEVRSKSASAKTSPTAPGRKPNWLMWTDDCAVSMSRSIGGNIRPSTRTSAVAVDTPGRRVRDPTGGPTGRRGSEPAGRAEHLYLWRSRARTSRTPWSDGHIFDGIAYWVTLAGVTSWSVGSCSTRARASFRRQRPRAAGDQGSVQGNLLDTFPGTDTAWFTLGSSSSACSSCSSRA